MSQNIVEDEVYTSHLSQLNRDNQVIAVEDIYNENGVLLLKKNAVVDNRASVQVARHKLRKPIHSSVAIDNTLTGEQLASAIKKYLSLNEDLLIIHSKNGLNDGLNACCNYVARFPLLLQKLTVMQHNMLELFSKTIAGAWWSFAISRQLSNELSDTLAIFLGALARDIGMLHIDPAVFQKEGGVLSQAEWRMIQGHVVVSKLVLDDIDQIPALTKRIVIEHHERGDGAGYPLAKQEDSLSEAGQIVAMSDAIQAIMHNQFAKKGLNAANLQGFLALNISTYSVNVYRAVMRLIRSSDIPPRLLIQNSAFPKFIEQLMVYNHAFVHICDQLDKLVPLLQTDSRHKEEGLLINFIIRIRNMRTTSGVPSIEYKRWMEHVGNKKIVDAYPEMELINSMFDELKWQFRQIAKYLNTLFEIPSINGDKNSIIQNLLNQLKKLSI